MSAYAQNLLKTAAFSLAIGFSISACSSTLAPEDDSTTEYVFEQSSSDQVMSKVGDKGRSDDNSDD
ncbi:MAG: hypothetical protein ACC655_07015 [Rhodothermia bacterium]